MARPTYANRIARPALGSVGMRLRGHEFHYASVIEEGPGQPLFKARDAAGREVGPMGLAKGRVAGSFLHVIDRGD